MRISCVILGKINYYYHYDNDNYNDKMIMIIMIIITFGENAWCVKYHITHCSIKMMLKCEKGHIIIFNYMQRFYYLTCQNYWCQNASQLIYQKGEIAFCEILTMLSIASLISMYDAELANNRNQVDVKIDPHLACLFFKHPVFHFAPTLPMHSAK